MASHSATNVVSLTIIATTSSKCQQGLQGNHSASLATIFTAVNKMDSIIPIPKIDGRELHCQTVLKRNTHQHWSMSNGDTKPRSQIGTSPLCSPKIVEQCIDIPAHSMACQAML